jgi:phthiocerol/phenolphthiocerol synthesis type-I polyketide synthase E
MFPGGGAQYMNMGRELYECEPFFREQVNRCISLVQPHVEYDLLALLYPTVEQEPAARKLFQQDFISLPILFIVEYALARLLMYWGITPQAMIGHSLGEYVAACLADVFTLEDALTIVALREKLSADIPQGAMLSILLSEQELQPFMHKRLSLAAINTPLQCVVSGMLADIEQLEEELRGRDIACKRLHIAAAGHSALLEPVLDQLGRLLQGITLHQLRIPFISNLSGTWITTEEATSPEYWTKHLRHTVRFSAGVQELLQEPERLLLEVGPGQSLSPAVKNILASQRSRASQDNRRARVLATMRYPQEQVSDHKYLLTALGHLWLSGQPIEWDALHLHQQCNRIPLPTYPFERQRYWIEPDREHLTPSSVQITDPSNGQTIVEDVALISTEVAAAFVAPRNENEQAIANIWQEVLGLAQVGREDNFFDLGGDSLISLKLIARLRETFSLDLPLRIILENPTIAQLAVSIDLLFIEEIEQLSDEEVKELLARELTADE